MAKTSDMASPNGQAPAEWRAPVPPLPRRAFPACPSLRPMQTQDLDAVLALEQRSYEFPWVFDLFTDCLRAGYCCWVGEDRPVLRGYGIMSVGAGECHILNLCVAPEFRRQGLGRYLMTHLLHLAQRRDVDTAFLEVRASNHGALALYRDMGFNEIGLRRAYYPGKQGGREDALQLARSL